jgi:uncharacterized protein (DUF2141 family)
MLRRVIPILVLLVVTALNLTCQGKTGITGQVILQTGQSGDVRNCRVQLFVSSDLTGSPVQEVASAATGTDETKANFEFDNIVQGYYYILAWKDLNGNGVVDNGDIVGVYGGTYRPGYGGSQVTVQTGHMTDVGQIVMLIYKQLIVTASATRLASQGVNFTYSFNDACTVTAFNMSGQGQNWSDNNQLGAKVAGTQYTSPADDLGWFLDQAGDPIPSGGYEMEVTGTWNGAAFDITVPVTVP